MANTNPSQDAGVILTGQSAPSTLPVNPATPGATPVEQAQAAAPNAAPEQPAPYSGPSSKPSIWQKAAGVLRGAINDKQTIYTKNPQTGKLESTQVQERPGAIFRNILQAALVGGAAAEEEHTRNPYGSPLGSALIGANAAQELAQKRDLEARQQAEQDFADKQRIAQGNREDEQLSLEKQRVENQWTYYRANMAHYLVQEAAAAHQANLAGERDIEQQNNQSRILLQGVLAQHGVPDKTIPMNGEPGNGPALQKYFTEHQGNMFVGPNGSTRVAVSTLDTTGLYYDATHGGWKDAEGKMVDLAGHTTWTVYSIPQTSSPSQTITVKGSTLQKSFPEYASDINPNGAYPIPVSLLFSMAAKSRMRTNQAISEERQKASESLARIRVVQSDRNDAETRRSQLQAHNVQLQKQLAEFGEGDPQAAALKRQIQQNEASIADYKNRIKQDDAEAAELHDSLPPVAKTQITVLMIDPNGVTRQVPQNQVEQAKKAGLKIKR